MAPASGIDKIAGAAVRAPETGEWVASVAREAYSDGAARTFSRLLARAREVDNPYLEQFHRTQANPEYAEAIKIVRGEREASSEEFRTAFKYQLATRYALTNEYAWSVPNPEAIATVASYGKILDAGAGTGYWAKLAHETGADVVAFDQHGADLLANRFHKSASKMFFPVMRGDEDMVRLHPDRTLFMSFPPADHPFAFNALRNYGGKNFLFAGELHESITGLPSSTGDEAFHDMLAQRWNEIKTVDIPNWTASDGPLVDKLHVFERKT